jgi:hypothetical protein
MKTTARVILRSLAATPFRVAIAYAGVLALFAIDFRPFPDWMGDALGYTIQFVTAYLLALWILHGRSTRWSDGLVVAFTFIVVGTLLELLFATVLRGPTTESLADAVSWRAFGIYSLYLAGALLATWQVRRRALNAVSRV